MSFDLLQQQLPTSLSRERRIELLIVARDALLEGRAAPPEASSFLGQALDRWLTDGGDLERDHLQTNGRPGSHHTHRFVALRLRERLLAADSSDDGPSSSRGGQADAHPDITEAGNDLLTRASDRRKKGPA